MNETNKKRYKSRGALLMHFLRGSAHLFLFSVLFAALTSLLDLVNPRIVGFTVDRILGDSDAPMPGILNRLIEAVGGTSYVRGHLILVAAAVIVIALAAAGCRYAFHLVNTMGAEKLVQTMRNDLFAHIERLPFTWYSENDTGDIIQRCTSDVDTVKRVLAEQMTSLLRISVMLALALSFMWNINPRLTIPAALFIPIIVLYSMFFHNKIGETFEKADAEEGVLSTLTQENLTGVRVVRAFGRERYERSRFEAQNEIYTAAYMKLSVLISAFWSAGDGISGLQVLTVLAIGAVQTVHGQMTAGDLIAFVSYNSMLVWPVRQLGRVISEMSKAGVSVDRIAYIMNAEEEQDRPDAVTPPMDRDICFDHVSFRYTPESPEILKDVSFTIPSGTTFGILGGTGSGKSTLMYLLKRMYDLPQDSGQITIGGVDIADMKADWLRSQIGMVLQEPFLFSRTIEENIAIAKADASSREVREAAGIASLDEAVRHFSKGYDTFVGERGVTLSGGQKQRTAIAQMVIQKTPVMIFDDSLSAVDTETDAKIRAALAQYAGSATIILISHRITTLMHADQIAVLSGGRIAEIGTHEELLEEGGIYRKICDIQSAGLDEGEEETV